MKKSFRRVTAIIFSVVLVISMTSVSVFADSEVSRIVCTHSHLMTSQYDPICVDTSANAHTWYMQYLVTCPTCGYSGIQRGEAMYSTAHRYATGQTGYPQVCLDCAHVK